MNTEVSTDRLEELRRQRAAYKPKLLGGLGVRRGRELGWQWVNNPATSFADIAAVNAVATENKFSEALAVGIPHDPTNPIGRDYWHYLAWVNTWADLHKACPTFVKMKDPHIIEHILAGEHPTSELCIGFFTAVQRFVEHTGIDFETTKGGKNG